MTYRDPAIFSRLDTAFHTPAPMGRPLMPERVAALRPKCCSQAAYKAGIVNRKQRWQCRECKRTWTLDVRAPRVKWPAIRNLLAQGWSQYRIASQLGCSRATVRRAGL